MTTTVSRTTGRHVLRQSRSGSASFERCPLAATNEAANELVGDDPYGAPAAVHIHPILSVYADGGPLEVSTDIGISYAEQAMAALHTHDTEGTVHVESPVVRDYTLGQFFDTWGVRLTKTCLGGYCAGGGKLLKAFVDGKPTPDPRQVKLVDQQRIVVAYGTAAEIAKAVG